MNRNRFAAVLGVCALMVGSVGSVSGGILFQDDFETYWSTDYASGWENADYRHGTPPVGKMMQQTTTAHSGTYGLQLFADSTPNDGIFWAGVVVKSLPANAMLKANDPWMSAWYYDQPLSTGNGQIFAVPSWVNPYIPSETPGGPGEDWTDIQFGGRRQYDVKDNFYSIAAGENSPNWQDTGVVRTEGWYNLKMQLSSSDGRVHFFINGIEKGATYRNDYTDLGTEIGLFTMFVPPLSLYQDNKPYTYWDDFQVGSAVPEPSTYIAGALLLLPFGMSTVRMLRKKA